jgi:hypothetical protein
LKTTYFAGGTVEVYKTMSWRYGKKTPRQKGRINPTPEKMADINEQRAEDHLRRLMNHNFTNGDYHIVLKYHKGKTPTPEEAKQHINDFKRDMRKLYKKNASELKYIHVSEYKGKRIHQHMLINNARIPIDMISKLWPYGSVNYTPLYSAPDYKDLAHYFIKETKNSFRDADAPSHRRWNPSRNLKQPKKTVRIINAKEWRETPAAAKGYILDVDSVKNAVREDGYPTQFYRLLEIKSRS